MTEPSAQDVWKEKLEFLQAEDAKGIGAEQFTLRKEIDEAEAKLREFDPADNKNSLALSVQAARDRIEKDAKYPFLRLIGKSTVVFDSARSLFLEATVTYQQAFVPR